jgi:hypothetical protein
VPDQTLSKARMTSGHARPEILPESQTVETAYFTVAHMKSISKKLFRTHHAGAKGERRYSSCSFSTSALDEVRGQSHAVAGKGTQWIGGWAGPRAGLDSRG